MRFFIFAFLSLFSIAASAQDILPKGNADQPIEIQADNLKVLQKDKVALFQGNVEAKQGTVRLKADEMRVYYKEKPASPKPTTEAPAAAENSVSKIDVSGNVFLATPEETVEGSSGVYNVEKALITLNGEVVITRGKNILKGAGLIYNLKTGYSEMQGAPATASGSKKERVRGVFVPEKTKKK